MRYAAITAIAVLVCASVVHADSFGTGLNEFEIDFVTISGDATSANGTNISQYSSGEARYKTFTDPGNEYRMGALEITNDQWDKFNAAYGTVTGNLPNAYNEEHRVLRKDPPKPRGGRKER